MLPAQSEVREILAIQVSRIGDTLLSTPTLRAIADFYPAARLTVLGHPRRVEILRHLAFIHHVGGISKNVAWLKGLLEIKRYDLAFVFGRDKALVRYAQRVAHRVVALRQGHPGIDAQLLFAAEEPGFQSRHAVLMQFAMIEQLGIPLGERRLAYCVAPEETEWAKTELQRRGLDKEFPLIGLQIASFPTKGYRDWPVENFAELAARVVQAYPESHFLIFGGDLEKDRTLHLAKQLGSHATHLAGGLSLRQTAALMNTLDYYIGVDTGPTHIMGALQRPMMTFYHPYSPSPNLCPLDHPALTVIDHPLAGKVGPEASMSDVSVDSVWALLKPQLDKLDTR